MAAESVAVIPQEMADRAQRVLKLVVIFAMKATPVELTGVVKIGRLVIGKSQSGNDPGAWRQTLETPAQ
jgi:hypothetical protein